MKNSIQSIGSFIFDSQCPVCKEKSGDKDLYLCYNCLQVLKRNSSLKKVDNLYYIWEYREKFRELILSYKGVGIKKIAVIIGELIREQLFHVVYEEGVDIIIPVPINRRRKNDRGFNQVEEVLSYLNYSYLNIKRVKNTKKMSKILNEDSRNKNIKSSFKVEEDLNNKTILILDDIVTTGSTIKEITKEIRKKNKPKKIIIFSLSISSTLRNKLRNQEEIIN